jgi:NADPH:quinone reductase-like Zn-dependent oxidoreductase
MASLPAIDSFWKVVLNEDSDGDETSVNGRNKAGKSDDRRKWRLPVGKKVRFRGEKAKDVDETVDILELASMAFQFPSQQIEEREDSSWRFIHFPFSNDDDRSCSTSSNKQGPHQSQKDSSIWNVIGLSQSREGSVEDSKSKKKKGVKGNSDTSERGGSIKFLDKVGISNSTSREGENPGMTEHHSTTNLERFDTKSQPKDDKEKVSKKHASAIGSSRFKRPSILKSGKSHHIFPADEESNQESKEKSKQKNPKKDRFLARSFRTGKTQQVESEQSKIKIETVVDDSKGKPVNPMISAIAIAMGIATAGVLATSELFESASINRDENESSQVPSKKESNREFWDVLGLAAQSEAEDGDDDDASFSDRSQSSCSGSSCYSAGTESDFSTTASRGEIDHETQFQNEATIESKVPGDIQIDDAFETFVQQQRNPESDCRYQISESMTNVEVKYQIEDPPDSIENKLINGGTKTVDSLNDSLFHVGDIHIQDVQNSSFSAFVTERKCIDQSLVENIDESKNLSLPVFNSGSSYSVRKSETLFAYDKDYEAFMAVQYQKFGSRNELKIICNPPEPFKISMGMVILKVEVSIQTEITTFTTFTTDKLQASTVSYSDCLIRKGEWCGEDSLTPPLIPGVDVVGTISRIGCRTSSTFGFHRGDRVMSLVKHGGNSRYISIRVDQLVKVPNGIEPTEAVCLAETYLAAFQAIHCGQLKSIRYTDTSLSAKSILIIGVLTNVGRAAAELARAAGAILIYAPCREHHRERVRALGVTPLGSEKEDFLELLQGKIDLVIDATAEIKSDVENYYTTLKPSGNYLLVGRSREKRAFILSRWAKQLSSRFSAIGTLEALENNVHSYDIYEKWDTNLDCCKVRFL